MDSNTNRTDAHHAFTCLAVEHSWLGQLESRARGARIETFDDLHRALTWVHMICAAHLPHPLSTVADCHLGKVLDDKAEVSWTEVAE